MNEINRNELLRLIREDKEIGQDEARGSSDKVQKMTDEMVAEADSVLSTKEAEIMQV